MIDQPMDKTAAEAPPEGGQGKPSALRRLHEDESGTTALEWALLLGVIALPAIYLISMALSIIVDYYRMMTTLNGLPFP